MLSTLTQDCVLGYSQPSLRDCLCVNSTQDSVLGEPEPHEMLTGNHQSQPDSPVLQISLPSQNLSL